MSTGSDRIAVTRYEMAMRHQAHRFDKRLSHQRAVERVLMVCGQILDRRDILDLDRQQAAAGLAEVAHHVVAVDATTAPECADSRRRIDVTESA